MADETDTGISAIVLAGGRGSRMGDRDKGLVEVDGKRLIEQVIEGLRSSVDEFIISCNRNLTEYERYGRVVPDREAGYAGPMMGVLSASDRARHDLCLVVPCDMPSLPADLYSRLRDALDGHDAVIANDGVRDQNLVMLVRKSAIAHIEDYLSAGNRSVKGWLESLDFVRADFSDCPDAFMNINRLD